mmetsp:Transcript_37705/g.99754  ORF Transcript_37705/g.99754 Transcript_37705/m.99754 type:complete len:360 (+) Transcript_37705:88-1167(+)
MAAKRAIYEHVSAAPGAAAQPQGEAQRILSTLDAHWLDNEEQIVDMTPQDWAALGLPVGLLIELRQLFAGSAQEGAGSDPPPSSSSAASSRSRAEVQQAATTPRPFTRDFYLGLRVDPIELIRNYFAILHPRVFGKGQERVSWEHELRAGKGDTLLFRARCASVLNDGPDRPLRYIGAWKTSKRLATVDCAAAMLELHQVDPAIVGGKLMRRAAMDVGAMPHDKETCGSSPASGVREVREDKLLGSQRKPVTSAFGSLVLPGQRFVEWSFLRGEEDRNWFRAVASVPLLGGRKFESALALGKKNAMRSAYVKIESCLAFEEERELPSPEVHLDARVGSQEVFEPHAAEEAPSAAGTGVW